MLGHPRWTIIQERKTSDRWEKPNYSLCAAQLEQKVISKCHEPRMAGHFYLWKTLKKVKKYFNWGSMNTDVQDYCQVCKACATCKTVGRKPKAEMRRYDVGLPMEEIAIDLMGPFPITENGNKYVLVVVDSFSKWMRPMPSPT